jgi:galactose mutarotase-like enzyme
LRFSRFRAVRRHSTQSDGRRTSCSSRIPPADCRGDRAVGRQPDARDDGQGPQHLGPQGIPFLAPWANRLDEQAFYANGKRYAFDMQLGNVRGPRPIHGFLAAAKWDVVEAKADAGSAGSPADWSFFKQPDWMAQFPFAHTISITHRLKDGALDVAVELHNLAPSRCR